MGHLEPPSHLGPRSHTTPCKRERERKPLFGGALLVLLAVLQTVRVVRVSPSKAQERGKPPRGALWSRASTCAERGQET